MAPNLYGKLIPELAPTKTVARHFKGLSLLCDLDQGKREKYFKILVDAKNILGEEEAKKYEIKEVCRLKKSF